MICLSVDTGQSCLSARISLLGFSDGLLVGLEIFRNFVYLLRRIYLIFNLLETSRTCSTIIYAPSCALVRQVLMLNCLECVGEWGLVCLFGFFNRSYRSL